ncbi:MAG: NYN domain-containing protein [Nitrospinae bacterium]|nr:NYN domain-containing protein [Nitrospinota bacterium]
MITEPAIKRATCFFDGQNLFHCAKEAFEITWPSFDPIKLSMKICQLNRWELKGVKFYTGIPSLEENKHWHQFWTAKLAHMGRSGIHAFSRPIRNGREKGIDIRIALDMVRLARQGSYDVAVIFSQDQDLTEAVQEIKEQAGVSGRWIKLVSAFPKSSLSKNKRGINKTDWFPFDSMFYDECLDPKDYRQIKQ